MAHNILGTRFYNRSSRPAWHGLGLNVGDDAYATASDAVAAIGGLYTVEKRKITISLNGEDTPTGYSAIVRGPIREDNCERLFGRPVPDDYEVITPAQAVELYDNNIRDASGKIAPVETLGILGKGDRLFISTKLPVTLDVKGDEVVTYLLYDNPMSWGNALGIYTTGIRTVCQNTLQAGISAAIEKRKIPHIQGATSVLADWLSGIYSRALVAAEELGTAYTKLANTRVNDLQVKWINEALYPLPKEPSFRDTAKRGMEERFKAYEYNVTYAMTQRRIVTNLFEGQGVGMDTDAVKGTAFGVYNAIAEFETYRRGDYATSTESLIAGERSRRIRTAFALCEVVDRYETVNPALVMKKVRV